MDILKNINDKNCWQALVFVSILIFPVSQIPLSFALTSANITVGTAPYSIAVNPSKKTTYVTNLGDNSVSVIDTSDNRIKNTIGVGTNPAGLAVNTKTNMIYVANFGGDQVSVIDGSKNLVVANIPVAFQPLGVGINQKNNMIYVISNGINNHTLSVINGRVNHVVKTIEFDAVDTEMVAVNVHKDMAYVTYSFSSGINNTQAIGNLAIIDGHTNEIVKTIQVGSSPHGVAVNPHTDMVYVANYGDNTISVINGITNSVVSTIPVGNQPFGINLDPKTNVIYVANLGDNSVSVIDGTTNTVASTLNGFNCPTNVGVDSNRDVIYVNNNCGNSIVKEN